MIAVIQKYHRKFHTGSFYECLTCAEIGLYADWAQRYITEEVRASNGGKLPDRDHR